MACDCALLRIEMKTQFAAVMQQLRFLERQNCVYFNGLSTKIVNLDRKQKSKPPQGKEIFSVIGTKSLVGSAGRESRTKSSIAPKTSSTVGYSYIPQSISNNFEPNITDTTSRKGQPSEMWRSSQTVKPSNRFNNNLDDQLTAVISAEPPFIEPKIEEPDELIDGTNPSRIDVSESKQTFDFQMEPIRQQNVFQCSVFSGGTKQKVMGRSKNYVASRFAAGNILNKKRVWKASIPIKSVTLKSGRPIAITASSKQVFRYADHDNAASNIVKSLDEKNHFCNTVSLHHAAHATNALSAAHQNASELYFGSDNIKLESTEGDKESTEGDKIPLPRGIGVGVKKPNMVAGEGNPNRLFLKGMANKRRDRPNHCVGPQPTTSSLFNKKRPNIGFDYNTSEESTNKSTAGKCIQKRNSEVERSDEVKPFKCNICLKKFVNMKRAIRCRQSHRLEYKCNICRYTTIKACDYNSHLKLHL